MVSLWIVLGIAALMFFVGYVFGHAAGHSAGKVDAMEEEFFDP
jgi:ABC-type dipeptide/oligopeptide/nickel transport system permease subunit